MSNKVTIQIKAGKKSVKLKMKFHPDNHSLYDVKLAYCDQEPTSLKPDKMVLYKTKKELVGDGKSLRAHGITKIAVLSMTSRLIGGALYIPNSKILNSKRNRRLDTSDPDIRSSRKPDCMRFITDIPRAEMPCGHAFCPQTMFDYVKSIITKNDYDFEIKCPADKCGVEFDFDLVAKVADMTEDEYLYFADIIAARSMPETQECPNSKCDAICERPESLKKFRVHCVACSFNDWCWICNGKWLGGGFTLCGNKQCPSTEMNEMLLNAPMKKTTYKDANDRYVEVPKIRACPKCLELIEHSDACKHMHCQVCGHDFCFSCLKGKVNGSWQCGSHRYQCSVAPKQKLN